MPRQRIPLIDRLMAKVCPEPNTGCWLWTGAALAHGYGEIWDPDHGHGVRKVTHVMWEHHRGPIPSGMHLCHKCDTPACCNPDHLFLGTIADNTADCVAKGRNYVPGKPLVAKAGIPHRPRRKLSDDLDLAQQGTYAEERARAAGVAMTNQKNPTAPSWLKEIDPDARALTIAIDALFHLDDAKLAALSAEAEHGTLGGCVATELHGLFEAIRRER